MRKIFVASSSLVCLIAYLLLAPVIPSIAGPAGAFPKEYLGAKADLDFVIFYTGDVKGNFEPCG